MEKNKFKNHFAILSFAIFAITIYAQYSHVFMYHDDYGYASLCYGVSNRDFGVDVSLSKILSFLKYHYMNVNGRIIAYFPLILCLRSGLLVTRLFLTLVITWLYINLYKIILHATKIKNNIPIVLIILSYGNFSVTLVTGCHYWYSAAFGYVVPFACFTQFILLSDKENLLLSILACFFLFISASSQEVVGLGVVSYVGIKFLYDSYVDKKIKWKSLFFVLISLCGFVFVVAAPGNGNRIAAQENVWFYDLSVFEKIKKNIPYVERQIFDKENWLLALIIYLSSAVCSLLLFFKTKGIKKILLTLCFVSTIVMISISAIHIDGYYDYLHSNTALYNAIFLFQLCLVFFPIFLYLVKNDYVIIIVFLVAGCGSLLSLLFVPSDVHNRTTLFFQISMICVVVTILSNCISSIKNNMICNIALILFSILPIWNFCHIYEGYKKNYDNNIYNDTMLRTIKESASCDVIYLKKLPLPEYADAQIQTYSGAKYIHDMIVCYYDFPDETIIIYE